MTNAARLERGHLVALTGFDPLSYIDDSRMRRRKRPCIKLLAKAELARPSVTQLRTPKWAHQAGAPHRHPTPRSGMTGSGLLSSQASRPLDRTPKAAVRHLRPNSSGVSADRAPFL